MTTPSALRAGDRVLFRSAPSDPEHHARVFPGSSGPGPRLERPGVLLDDPQGAWVRIQYDDQPDPDSALVETLTRLDDGDEEWVGRYVNDQPANVAGARLPVDAIADDVSLAAERLREYPERRGLADELSVIASKLRATL